MTYGDLSDYFNHYQYTDIGRLKEPQKKRQKKLRALISDCIKVELDENYQLISVSTFRLKSKSSDPKLRHWRIIRKIAASEDFDPCGDLVKECAVQAVLDNRHYFKPCHCCGSLSHIDLMINQVCQSCQTNTPDESEWVIESFKEHFLKLVSFPRFRFHACNPPYPMLDSEFEGLRLRLVNTTLKVQLFAEF